MRKTIALILSLMIGSVLAMPVSALHKSESGNMTNWGQKDGEWYVLDNNGQKLTGWYKDEKSCWFFFDKDGIMQTEWVASIDKWYYMGSYSGVMQGNTAVEFNDIEYYLLSNGSLATNYTVENMEYDTEGKGSTLSNESVVLKDASYTDADVKGNLYITGIHENINLTNVTIDGYLTIQSDNSVVELDNVSAKDLVVHGKDTVVRFSGDTEFSDVELMQDVTLEEERFNGNIGNIKVTSTVKESANIGISAKSLTNEGYAAINIKKPLDNVTVNNTIDVEVNADVEFLTISERAENTVIKISEDVNIEKIHANAPSRFYGEGTVDRVNINSEDVNEKENSEIVWKAVVNKKDYDTNIKESKRYNFSENNYNNGNSNGGTIVPEVKEHTVTFDFGYAGDSDVAVKVKDGTSVAAPSVPSRDGFNFLGWFTEDGTSYNFAKAVASSFTLIAHWEEIISEPELYEVEGMIENESMQFEEYTGQLFESIDGEINVDAEILKKLPVNKYTLSNKGSDVDVKINFDLIRGNINTIRVFYYDDKNNIYRDILTDGFGSNDVINLANGYNESIEFYVQAKQGDYELSIDVIDVQSGDILEHSAMSAVVAQSSTANVSNANEFIYALNDPNIKTINMVSEISVYSNAIRLKNLTRDIVIDGNNHKITITDDEAGMRNKYAITVSNTDNTVAINDLTIEFGDFGLLIEGANVALNNVTFSNIEFAAVKVENSYREPGRKNSLTANNIVFDEERHRPFVMEIDSNDTVENTTIVIDEKVSMGVIQSGGIIYHYLHRIPTSLEVYEELNEWFFIKDNSWEEDFATADDAYRHVEQIVKETETELKNLLKQKGYPISLVKYDSYEIHNPSISDSKPNYTYSISYYFLFDSGSWFNTVDWWYKVNVLEDSGSSDIEEIKEPLNFD